MATATMKLRSDLVISRQDGAEGTAFVIKDPVTERFFRFKETEHFIAQQFDGATLSDTVRQRVEERLGITLSPENLEQFVNRLQRLGHRQPAVRAARLDRADRRGPAAPAVRAGRRRDRPAGRRGRAAARTLHDDGGRDVAGARRVRAARARR